MKLIVRYRFMLLAMSAAFSLAVIALMPPGEFDTNLENMLPAGDPVRQTYEQLVGSFSSDEVVIAGYVDPELFDPSGVGIERLEELSNRLAAVPGVRSTISLADIDAALSRLDLLGRFTSSQPHAVLRDTKLAANALALAEQITHGKDRESAAIVCLLEAESMVSENTMQTLAELMQIMDDLPQGMSEGVVAGEATIVYEGSRLLEEDGWRLLTMAIALMTGVLAVCFRSLFWALAPLVVVALCTAMTQCAVTIAGSEATIITSMLSSVVAVISIAAAVHVIARIRAKLASGLPLQSALPAALGETIRPIVWAAVTDCVAFAALIGSDVTVVSEFGVAMSIGALLVPLAILLVIPGLAGFAGPVKTSAEKIGWASTSLASVADMICRRPRVTAILSLGVAAAATAGLATLKINTDFIATFDENTRIVQSYEFAESKLGGAGSWDVMIPAPEQLSGEFIERVDRLEQRLRALQIDGEPVVTKVISVVDFLSIAGEWTPVATRAQMLNWAPNGLQASFLGNAEGQSWLRMMLRSSERQSVAAKQQAIALVQREVERTFPAVDKSPAGQVTGPFVLLSYLIDSTMQDQWKCLAISLSGVFIALVAAIRRVGVAMSVLVVNVMPVAAVLGLAGWLGVEVDLGVAMIAAISLGISVDGSLHLWFDLRRLLDDGREMGDAIVEAETNVGPAVMFSTLALAAGFSSLAVSNFAPTVSFGVLTAAAMLGSLVGNLIVLPSLLLSTSSVGTKSQAKLAT